MKYHIPMPEAAMIYREWESIQNKGVGVGIGFAFGGIVFGGWSWIPPLIGLTAGLLWYGLCRLLLDTIIRHAE